MGWISHFVLSASQPVGDGRRKWYPKKSGRGRTLKKTKTKDTQTKTMNTPTPKTPAPNTKQQNVNLDVLEDDDFEEFEGESLN